MKIEPSTYWGGERNRCVITTVSGPMMLSVPIYDSRKEQPIEDVRICYMHAWQRQHWTAIFSAYGKTPYFMYYADYIRAVYEKQPKYLVDLNNETAYILRSLLENRMPNKKVEAVEPVICSNILDILFEHGPYGLEMI